MNEKEDNNEMKKKLNGKLNEKNLTLMWYNQ